MIWARRCNVAVGNHCRLRNIWTLAPAVVPMCRPQLSCNICNKFASALIPKGILVSCHKARIPWHYRKKSLWFYWIDTESVDVCASSHIKCPVITYCGRLIDPNLLADYRYDINFGYRSTRTFEQFAQIYEKCRDNSVFVIRFGIRYSFE